MGEHTEKQETAETPAEPVKRDVDWVAAKDRFVTLLAGVVRWVCLIFALILVLYIVFVVAEANKNNGIVEFIRDSAGNFTLGVGDLFTPSDPKLTVLVNYGIAAIIWLIIGAVGAKIIRRVGGVSS